MTLKSSLQNLIDCFYKKQKNSDKSDLKSFTQAIINYIKEGHLCCEDIRKLKDPNYCDENEFIGIGGKKFAVLVEHNHDNYALNEPFDIEICGQNETLYCYNQWLYTSKENKKAQKSKIKILCWLLVKSGIAEGKVLDFEKKSIYANGNTTVYDYYKTYLKQYLKEEITKYTRSCEQRIYFGLPGSGKSHKIKTDLNNKGIPEENIFRTTFHPDTDYSCFVGCYKPIMVNDVITYKYQPQVFTLAYMYAWQNPKEKVFLIIEEINRGNCAQIFGDLFQLLDRRNSDGVSEYAIKADTDLADYLKNEMADNVGIYQGKLCLPPNLSILATMNTSDQSLFPMDSAFKRRWDWEYVPCKPSDNNFKILIGEKEYSWQVFRQQINAKIKEATDSEDKQLGSFFIKNDIYKDEFKSKVMFYLWSEIFKEEYKTQNNYFRYYKTESKNETPIEFTFNELFESENDEEILNGFMKYLSEEANKQDSNK